MLGAHLAEGLPILRQSLHVPALHRVPTWGSDGMQLFSIPDEADEAVADAAKGTTEVGPLAVVTCMLVDDCMRFRCFFCAVEASDGLLDLLEEKPEVATEKMPQISMRRHL